MMIPKTLKEVSYLGAIGALILFTVTACGSDDEKTTDKTSKGNGADVALNSTPTKLRVFGVHDHLGRPLANASVLIGLADGNPFAGNRVSTDSQGTFTAPDLWQQTLPVTIEASGFIRTTFTDVAPDGTDFELQLNDGTQDLAVDGSTVDFGDLRIDGHVDFGFIMPVLTRQSLLQFDVSQIISPQNDEVKILTGKMKLPSNITLPNQRKVYFFNFKLDKPHYRTFVRAPGVYDFVAAYGTFPVATVVIKIKAGDSFLDFINDFNFVSAGFGETQVTDQGGHLDIPVNQVPFDTTIQVQAPELDENNVMIAMALTEKDGKLYPTDVKKVLSDNARALKTSGDANPKYILSMMKNDSPEGTASWAQLSFALQKTSGSDIVKPKFLDLIPPPTYAGGVLKLSPPARVNDITPVGTYVVLSEIETYMAGSVKAERRNRIWEVYTPNWSEQLPLPAIPIARNPQKSYRWDVLFLGRQGDAVKGSLFENVTHISRNVLDI